VVFGLFFQSRYGVLPHETSADFALAMFFGIIFFQVLAETMGIGPLIIVSNANLVKKVVFPLDILPLAQLGAIWFHLAISLVLLLIGVVIFGRGITVTELVWLPVMLGPLLLGSMGLAWLLSALGVFFRDVSQVMPFFTQIMMWSSAIIYPLSRVHTIPLAWSILKWNPLLELVRVARETVLWDMPVNGPVLAYVYIFSILLFCLGRWVFNQLQPAFADVI
jgi:lipopolysaccharide transport system permease protein